MLSEYSKKNRDLLLGDSNVNQLLKNKEFQRLYSFLQSHSSTIQKLIMNQTMKSFPNNSFISPSLPSLLLYSLGLSIIPYGLGEDTTSTLLESL